MKLKTFFEKFELFADMPDAVAKMRELVLQLGVRGKLVGQKTSEPSAIDCIRKATKPLVEVAPDESIATPAGWVALPLGCLIASNIGGGTPSKSNPGYWNGPIPWASVKDVQSEKYLLSTVDSITEQGLRSSSSNLIPRNRLLVVTRMGLGKLAINKVPVAINQDLRAIEPTTALDLNFAYLLFKSLKMVGSGVTVKGITVDKLHAMPVLAPPLAEQKRIVAKVDELMALCDRLQAQQQERETRHAALARASLARFAEAPTPANLDLLFHNSHSIPPADLRKFILTLAIQGKLVSQDPDDEPAEHLLTRVSKERTALLQDGYPNRDESSAQLRKQQAQALPQNLGPLAPGWTWVTLMQASLLVVDCHNKTAPYVESGIRLLRTTNIRDGRLNNLEARYVDDATYERWSARCKPAPGDLLITREAPMGEACIIPDGMKVCLGQRMMLIRTVPGTMETKYLLYSLMAPDLMDRVQDKPVGATVQHLRVGGVETLLAPIPPVAEQRRIVAKVDELMALVDALEAQLATARIAGAALLEAAIHELLNPTAEIIAFPSSERGSLPDRAAIGCYAIQRLGDQRTFGRTAEVKVLYLAEAHLGLDLGGRYLRDAAGPLDRWIYQFERDAARLRWFSFDEGQTKDGHKKIEYRAGSMLAAKSQEASTRLSAAQRSEFDRLLGLLAQRPTVDVEIIATLFAAWNDFLIDGRQPTDDEIAREVRENWHPSKQRFSEPELKTWLTWLRQHALVPQGRGPRTVGQQGTLQLH